MSQWNGGRLLSSWCLAPCEFDSHCRRLARLDVHRIVIFMSKSSTEYIIQQREKADRIIDFEHEARLNYSPACVDCEWFDFTDDICEMGTDETPYPIYPLCNHFKQ